MWAFLFSPQPEVFLFFFTIWAPYVRLSVHTSVGSDFSEVYGSNSLKLYTKIRYGQRIMHVK